MEDKTRNTKQDIKETALTMFSQRGYSAVSIRDICGEVGIKESTVYYHYKNKQDIFESLLTEFKEMTNAVQGRFDCELAKITAVDEEPFIAVGLAFLNGYLLQERILKFIRMLLIEQHVNAEAATLYHQILFEAPLKQNAVVFAKLIQMGCFVKSDVDCLAVEYYAPIFLIFERYFASGEIREDKREKANEMLTAYLRNFYGKYSVVKDDDGKGKGNESLQK